MCIHVCVYIYIYIYIYTYIYIYIYICIHVAHFIPRCPCPICIIARAMLTMYIPNSVSVGATRARLSRACKGNCVSDDCLYFSA